MLSKSQIDAVINAALLEDAPWGDLTSETLVPQQRIANAQLVARESGVVAGTQLFARTFELVDSAVKVSLALADGDAFDAGTVLAEVTGPARSILRAERIALNLVQRLSGIATLTAAYVKAVAGTDTRIVDTRKTTPGLRALERHAVRAGGGHNHRFSLSDAVMVKDNHLAALGAESAEQVTEALRALRRQLSHTTHIEVEIDRLDQLDAVLAAEVDTIMLDNFSLDDLREGVKRIQGRAWVEASGGVALERVADIAATGVDVISVGALTHSARSLDLGLDFTLE
ncbi:carboxylating nicotinate-nucleotide diphosphorylase [Carnimonas bestiolae]|uniref:carboxylating nicotinate-nucleotide diphosphorylase n=1 Tax=Carnimonas bestiolae TaxID=3402172 RepID=UPI003EDBF719